MNASLSQAIHGGHAARLRVRRRLRVLRVVALCLPMLAIAVNDLARRGGRLADVDGMHALGYVGSLFVSAAAWAGPLYVACNRRRFWRHVAGTVFVVAYALATGVQAAFFRLFNVYLTIDAQYFATDFFSPLVGTMPLGRPIVVWHLALGLATALAILFYARRVVRPRWLPRPIRPPFLAISFAIFMAMPVSYQRHQSSSPDLIYFHGLSWALGHVYRARTRGEVLLVRVERRDPLPLPRLVAKPPHPRNVLFVLQESQRADETCTAYEPNCRRATRATNPLLPNRFPFLEMRATGSSTAVVIATLWSGLLPTDTKKDLLEAPLLWDYAHAAGYDNAYWTSQHLIFGNSRLYVQDLPVSHFASGTEIDPLADILTGAPDAKLTDRIIADWPEIREPFFVMAHYSNIHRPRLFDKEQAPFDPTDFRELFPKNEQQRNFYRNVIYLSDVAVARLVKHVRSLPMGDRTIIVYMSDHGESYFEHQQDIDHSGSLYDEEIRVPFWIDAPPGTLTPEEEKNLRSLRTTRLFHVDVAPTVLDLLGLWDAPELAPFKAKMIGHPMTRSTRTLVPIPLTNVSWVWEYVAANWGMMQGSLKLEAREPDKQYHCFDVAKDPRELHDLGQKHCGGLLEAADRTYHMMPGELGRLERRPDWANGP